MKIKSNLVDILQRKITPSLIIVEDGQILSITPINEYLDTYILPGFIDAHVHIESSLLIPSEFASLAVTHGTVGTVSDPHEIANVLGKDGVEFMIQNGKKVPFHFFFGAPSCVPATNFESTGALINSNDIAELLKRDDIFYLSEMMNYPGVLFHDPEVMKKISAAHSLGKPVDGHAPGLRGNDLAMYAHSGISTDHECFTLEEAEEKISLGMKILIREGSAAKNFEALIPLIKKHPRHIMFCSDDKHPDSLLEGHINSLVARAIAMGYDMFDVLMAACINPVEHYKLPVGLLKPGDHADFIITRELRDFIPQTVVVGGQKVYDNNQLLFDRVEEEPVNHFNCTQKEISDFDHTPESQEPVIVCMDGQLITNKLLVNRNDIGVENDILKLVVVNRYSNAPVAVSYLKNFGLKRGALASSVAHDSHNIIATGVSDEEICNAVNLIITHQGGLSISDNDFHEVIPLPFAGLMSGADAHLVARAYSELHERSLKMGSTLSAPFMTLSFMALLVIPSLKLSDMGLFDGDSFALISLPSKSNLPQ